MAARTLSTTVQFLHLADLAGRAGSDDRSFFFTGGMTYSTLEKVGFVSQGPEAERIGFRYDTGVAGNSNGGHLWGTALNAEEKRAMVEYLKTL